MKLYSNMRKIVVAILLLVMVGSVYAQKEYSYRLTAIPVTNLPYTGGRPVETYAFDYHYFPLMSNKMWKDFQLTIPIDDDEEGWPYSALERRFPLNENGFYIGLLEFGAMDFSKDMLFVLDKNHNYLDALEVVVQVTTNVKNVYIKRFEISADGLITVYQLCPTSTTPIMVYSPVSFPLRAQRSDTMYRIDADGKFYQVKQVLYQPQDYTEVQFTNPNYNIGEGKERIVP